MLEAFLNSVVSNASVSPMIYEFFLLCCSAIFEFESFRKEIIFKRWMVRAVCHRILNSSSLVMNMRIICGYGLMQRRCLKTSEMVRMVAISVCLLLMLTHHHANGQFNKQLKSLLKRKTRHLEKVPESQSVVSAPVRVKRESPDYNSELPSDGNLGPGNLTQPDGDNIYDGDYPDPNCPDILKYQLQDLFEESYIGPVCNIIEVRNTADQLKDLENCTIVNGFVHIVFMHNLTDADMMKYRFPKLRVITQYLLIFRVFNLKTLRYMFPNLAVIGGLKLFRGYSLVLYENYDMSEIGLQSLQFINQGNVRIEKNPSLCYIRTIDWSRLGSFSNKEITAFMRGNRNPAECVDQCGEESGCENDEKGEGQLCWGLNACQKKSCPSKCLAACDSDLQCTCHEQCLAGCSRPNDPTACHACKDKYFNNTCLSECPPGKYLIHGWLCIEAEECQNLDWHFFEGQCLFMCPSGYEVNITNCRRQCVECEEDCGDVCAGDFEITTLESLHKVENCRAITGALTIRINGGSNVVEKLDWIFKDLEVVGTLVVHKSFPLVTLSFLKNLKRITGESMQAEIYSIYFLENHNLEELWNITASNLVVDKGKAFFHVNPKLCDNKITEIERLTPLQEDKVDISNVTNGDRATCEMKSIVLLDPEIYVKPFVIIKWMNYILKDERTLIGYQVYFKESPQKNATQYDGVDACRLNSWSILEKLKSSTSNLYLPEDPGVRFSSTENANTTSLLLPDLKAYTQYAYYVRATTTSKDGAISEIRYFRTKPARPSNPRNVKTTAVNSSSIAVTWDPPLSPNGIVTHYIIEWQREPEPDIDNARAVNTCVRPVNSGIPVVQPTTSTTKPEPETPADKLVCPKCDCSKKNSLEEEKVKAKESSDFENFLHDYLFPSALSMEYGGISLSDDESEDEALYEDSLYVDGIMSGAFRKKRSVYDRPVNSSTYGNDSVGHTTSSSLLTKPPSSESTAAAKIPLKYPRYRMVVTGTNATLLYLHHFAEYDIHIYACNHASDPQTKTNLSFPIKEITFNKKLNASYISCSMESLTRKRPLRNKEYDKIPQESITVTGKTEGFNVDKVRLSWQMPPDPNAYIRSFSVAIDSADENNFSRKICVSVNKTADELGYVSIVLSAPADVPTGTYAVKIQPLSLAGRGDWSEPVQFSITDLKHQNESNRIAIIISAVLSFVVIAIIVFSIIYVKSKQKPSYSQGQRTDINPDYEPYVHIPPEYEIEADKVEILEEIGHGYFGKVSAGIVQNIVKGQDRTKVAVKKLHKDAIASLRYEFLKEARLMTSFNAYHVVRLLGVAHKTTDLMVIMEYMEKGDLKSYLRSKRDDLESDSVDGNPPTLQEKLQMAAEIADGMAYLATFKFVHRDLAARNCLVNEHGTVKIGDFGLARDVYETDYYRKESRGFLPIRWMAPESLKDGIFQSSSDVWSYGVVLWELATLAEQPYQGKPHDEVTRFVIDGGYMERPKNCPKKLYDLMTVCWQFNPKMRPEFLEIVQLLIVDTNDEFKEVCFYGSDSQIRALSDKRDGTAPTSSDGTDASFPYADLSKSPVTFHTEANGQPGSRGRYYLDGRNSKKPTATGIPLLNSVDKQCLLAPESHHEREDPMHGDTRSLNTTSTTAPRTPSFGKKTKSHDGYGSGSSCDNDTDEEGSLLHDGYVSARDSGTFVHQRPHKHLARHNRFNKDQAKHVDCDLESGVDEGMWGNSTSHSSASTPTELHGLLPLDHPNEPTIMHTASSKC